MQADFWHQRWEKGQIGFHESEINPLLIAHFNKLNLRQGQRVFVPLCGKTHDISWLLNQGYRIAGAELSEQAIKALFNSLNIKPKVSVIQGFLLYQAENIDIFVGDLFNLSDAMLGAVDAIYDRAALVALPTRMRVQYSQHLVHICHTAKQLLICFDYEQTSLDGPPFAVNALEVQQHYADKYQITMLSSAPLVGDLKGKTPALQQTWLLQNTVSYTHPIK